jgi:hypothetical protein
MNLRNCCCLKCCNDYYIVVINEFFSDFYSAFSFNKSAIEINCCCRFFTLCETLSNEVREKSFFLFVVSNDVSYK